MCVCVGRGGGGSIGLFCDKSLRKFLGVGGLISIQVRNAMNVFCRDILLFKRIENIENKDGYPVYCQPGC